MWMGNRRLTCPSVDRWMHALWPALCGRILVPVNRYMLGDRSQVVKSFVFRIHVRPMLYKYSVHKDCHVSVIIVNTVAASQISVYIDSSFILILYRSMLSEFCCVQSFYQSVCPITCMFASIIWRILIFELLHVTHASTSVSQFFQLKSNESARRNIMAAYIYPCAIWPWPHTNNSIEKGWCYVLRFRTTIDYICYAQLAMPVYNFRSLIAHIYLHPQGCLFVA